jgi:hypothetical protein
MTDARPASRRLLVLVLSVVSLLAGCATLQEIVSLRNVDFALAGTTQSTLAGVGIGSLSGYRDLSAIDVARVGAAFASGQLPFETTLLVRASNPAENGQARLTALDWTLFLDDRETISGALDREYVLPPGEPVDVPVRVRLDLLDFFDRQLEDVVNLALAAGGAGEPTRIHLEATPSVQTPLGVMRFPEPIVIGYDVGGGSAPTP